MVVIPAQAGILMRHAFALRFPSDSYRIKLGMTNRMGMLKRYRNTCCYTGIAINRSTLPGKNFVFAIVCFSF